MSAPRLRAPRVVDEDLEWIETWSPRALSFGVRGVLLVLVVLVALASVIRYPEVLVGSVQIVGDHPPIPVVPRTNARVVELRVDDGQEVEQGAILVVLDSSARASDVLALRELVDLRPELSSSDLEAVWQLGSLRDAHVALLRALRDREALVASSVYDDRLSSVDHQIALRRALSSSLTRTQTLLSEREGLRTEQLSAARVLVSMGASAAATEGERQLDQLGERLSSLSAQTDRLSNDLAVAALERERIEIAQRREEELRQTARQIDLARSALLQGLAEWVHTYLLVSPIRGRVALFEPWRVEQSVQSGAEGIWVVPESPLIVGRMTLSQEGSGRAQIGQEVQIRLDAWPMHEFGTLRGVISSISETARRDGLAVTIALPDGCRSTRGREIPVRPGTTGTGLLVTSQRTVLGRLLGPIYTLLRARGLG